MCGSLYVLFFFFNDTATTEIYTLSLHDALPISAAQLLAGRLVVAAHQPAVRQERADLVETGDVVNLVEQHQGQEDRKSTRLNSSHLVISYAVFCLKKKNIQPIAITYAYYKTHLP